MARWLRPVIDGAVTGALVCGLFTALFMVHAWAIMLLWNWYVTPLGPPEIGKASALGLALVVSLFAPRSAASGGQPQTGQQTLKGLGIAFVRPLLCVAAGWVVLHLQ